MFFCTIKYLILQASECVFELFVLLQVPFLSVGGDMGWREEVSKGVSELSGEYCVENVKGEDGELYRRLIFLSNAALVQSESRLVSSNTGQFFSLVHSHMLYFFFHFLFLYDNQYIRHLSNTNNSYRCI